MSEDVVSYCRQCEGWCGVVATVDDGRITDLRGDPDNPVSRGFLCGTGRSTIEAPGHASRLRQPLRREGDRLVPVDWERAIREIGDRLGSIRRSAGPRAVGVYAGSNVAPSPRDVARTAAFAFAMGTPNLFTSLANVSSPLLYATEQVVGHPTALLSDVGRAHYTVLLGGNQQTGQWGPLQSGAVLTEALRGAKARKARLVVADPRRTPLAEMADVHLPIRPGTDTYLMLGMLGSALEKNWFDAQYVRDYCAGFDELREAMSGWTTERAAELCGIDRAALAGVALKFARAAMATVHRGRGQLLGPDATVGSFALLALHAVTANLLRPGGLYDANGIVDFEALGRALPTDKAPRSRVAGVPAVLAQLPVSLLADEALTPGDGQLRALVVVGGDPARTSPDTARVEQALAGLDLLVCMDPYQTTTSRHAHFVLPTVHFWEREDAHLHDSPLLPSRFAQRTRAVVPPTGEARTADAILADLLGAANPPMRGGEWGLHLRMLGRIAGRSDLSKWESRAWDLLSDVSSEELDDPRGVSRGEVDRSRWSVSRADNRLQLAPEAILRELGAMSPSADDPDRPFYLGSRSRSIDQPATSPAHPVDELVVELHPEAAERLGASEGGRVIVQGEAGEFEARVVFDPALRKDTLIVPGAWGPLPDLGGQLETPLRAVASRLDPLTGAPAIAGARVAVRPG